MSSTTATQRNDQHDLHDPAPEQHDAADKQQNPSGEQGGDGSATERDRAERGAERFSTRSDGCPVVVIAGATPGAGATGIAAAVIGAALRAGLKVHVIDAGCPRRSGLRQVCPIEGRARPVGAGVSIVSSQHDGLALDYLDGPLDTRCDTPARWPTHHGVDLVVIDAGISVEEALTAHPDATCWWDPRHVPDAWVVLVTGSSLPVLGRCELVLDRWSPARLSPVAQVITTGALAPSERVRALTGAYIHQALNLASHATWDPARHVAGITTDQVHDDLAGTGTRVLSGLGGNLAAALAPPVVARGRRGFTHRRKDSPSCSRPPSFTP